MDVIKSTSFVLRIIEYGETVRQYNDIDHTRFLRVSKSMVDDHMDKNIMQNNGKEVKNTRFHFYTY